MIDVREKSEYVDADPHFKPLPKYGHLSEKTPEFAAVEAALGAAYDTFWNLPDLPTFRRKAGSADAVMPPGGPDRYRDVKTELLHFPARDGHLVELKVYKSPNVLPNATLMYRMHGGGFCVGGHETDGVENVYAATNPNIVVVSVDYRLAPEHPFPIPLEDSYDGLLWCKKNAETLGVNPERIILSGSSAGANLAAVLAILARDDGVSGLVAQVLHFAALCHPKFFPSEKYEFGSYIQDAENCVLSDRRYEAFSRAYLPDLEPDYRHSPLLATSLAGLPPALGPPVRLRPPVMQSAGVDIFRDMGLAYSEALEAADVDVEMHCYGGVPHCFPALLPTHGSSTTFYERYNTFLEKHGTATRR
ncbi:alpha/beta hydrolase fold-domain-containing protein [Xylaria sp. CBS 124048]|nr:alpha/beta hydrolase fold-domain-containing protein [Xylaria sp. CBS 124048]